MGVPPSAKPNNLGVVGGDLAGYPDGRRLADDVTDISLKAVAGRPLPPRLQGRSPRCPAW